MDELIKQLSQKVGISEEQARMALNVVLEYLKDKLPGPIAEQVEGLFKDGGDGPDLGGMLKKGLGGLLG
ncbi:MAG: HU family DNA-binding protein [Chloroflexi bacterium]|nr:HU family DNA-binding protein [Chloroflexota bacterium]